MNIHSAENNLSNLLDKTNSHYILLGANCIDFTTKTYAFDQRVN